MATDERVRVGVIGTGVGVAHVEALRQVMGPIWSPFARRNAGGGSRRTIRCADRHR